MYNYFLLIKCVMFKAKQMNFSSVKIEKKDLGID